MDVRGKTVIARFAWVNGKIEEDVAFHVDADGIISGVAKNDVQDVVRLDKQVILPGFVNTHSHAFHRHLRGRSEIGKSAADTFWKWRDNMYELVADVDNDLLYQYCLSTFREMVRAGITTVGEFHYVHHCKEKFDCASLATAKKKNGLRFDLDEAVIRAAIDAGIRIVLLQTLYEQAGFDAPQIHPVQERFISSYEEFVRNLKTLLAQPSHKRVKIGVAAHSARAVPFENIKKLYNLAVKENIPFHIHLEEQPKELADCQRFLGSPQTPADVLLSSLRLGANFTAVHATYTSPENMQSLARFGANVSICPCTEGYLGDGVPQINDHLSVSFGTDCNNRICFLEEMRWACYSQQMTKNSRSVAGFSAEKLLAAATRNGAVALGLADVVGGLEVGKYFDAVAFDVDSPVFANVAPTNYIDAVVFSCGNREISHVFVAGKQRNA